MPATAPCAPQRARPTPAYLRLLVDRSRYTIGQLALLLGVGTSTLERYLREDALVRNHVCPYPLQYALEQIADAPNMEPTTTRRRRSSKDIRQ